MTLHRSSVAEQSSAPTPLVLLPAVAPPSKETGFIEPELRAFAAFLAGDAPINFNLRVAAELDVNWYCRQIGEDVCTFGDGCYLRLLTMQVCRDTIYAHRFSDVWPPVVPPAQPREQMGTVPHQVADRPYIAGLVLLVIMFLVTMVFAALAPTGPQSTSPEALPIAQVQA